MFRLKHLDDNETPDNLLNGRRRHLDPSLLLSADNHLDTPPSEFLNMQPDIFSAMVVSAAVFHNGRLLLVQRSDSDTYPGHWEIPGGSANATDKTIRESVSREFYEETGLKLKKIVQQILPAETFKTGWDMRAKKWLKVSFIVEIAEEDGIEAGEKIQIQEIREVTNEQVANKTRKLEVSKSDMRGIGGPVVKLDPKEHQQHLWVTEDEVKKREVEGKALDFICDEQVHTLLAAFKLRQARESEMSE